MTEERETPETDKLKQAKIVWDSMVPSLPSLITLNGGTTALPAVITDWFSFVIRGVEAAETSSIEPGMQAIHWPSITSSIQQIVQHMNSAKQNGAQWLSQTCTNLHSFLWQIRSALVWLLPPLDNADVNVPSVKEILASADQVLGAAKQASENTSRTAQLRQQAEKASEDVAETAEKIAGYERAANNAQTNAQGSATAAETERLRVDQFAKELETATETQKSLFDQFEEYRKVVEGTIQGASKVALAKSFQTRRETLEGTQKIWAGVFLVGITILLLAGAWITHELVTASQPSAIAAQVGAGTSTSAASAVTGTAPLAVPIKSELAGLIAAMLRFIVVSPIIWLTWFAARQYRHCLRLSEDYAFKEAAAHAFVGYRSEMGDDPDMIKMLREYAIKNFGANPIRVLSKDEPVTPLNDVIGNALEKVNPDKILDVVKEAIGATKK